MEPVAPKEKKFIAHFPVTKVKKIIQENQEIGKLSNLVPPLVEQSLQYFLTDLIKKSEQIANDHGSTKLSPAILKHALKEMTGYGFMKDALDDVEDEIVPLAVRKSTPRQPKRSKSENDKVERQGEGEKQKQKRGRKKVKLVQLKQQGSDGEQEQEASV